MSANPPTPLLMGNKRPYSAKKLDGGEIAIDERRRDELLDLLATIALVGPSSAIDKAPNLQQSVIDEVNPFVHDRIRARRLVDIWVSILDAKITATATDLIFIEFWASIGYAQVKQALSAANNRFRYTQTLFAIRKRVAFNLYDYAKDLNWQQPVTFVSALKVSRAYLRDAAGHSTTGSGRDYGQFSGKLGVATVLISGFEAITQDEAREAYQAIRLSLDYGNDAHSALPYLINAATISFDYSGNIEDLVDALDFSQSFGQASRSIPLRLAVAQAELRIALCTNDERLLARVAASIEDVDRGYTPRVTDFLTAKILKGIVKHLQKARPSDVDASQLRVPFGYRTGDQTHPLLVSSAQEVLAEIDRSYRVEDPMVADLLADLIVNCRSRLKMDEVESLAAAVRYRKSGRAFGLVRAQNELELASLVHDPLARLAAARSLAHIACDARFTAAAQMVLAQNLETWGAISNAHESHALSDEQQDLDLVEVAVNGTARDLWLLAAKSAIENANLIKRSLGGRSSVTTVGDYYGLVTETLVFKRMDAESYQRGGARSEEIRRSLNAKGLSQDFGVPIILDAEEIADDVVVAHRFVSGVSLMSLFETADGAERLQRAVQAARFLGLINRIEASNVTDDGVRRTLKSKEVGRFLKACGIANFLEPFERWWRTVEHVDRVPRKDAHLDNWLLGQGEQLVAIDWEAAGCRPIGYELAQITDDHAYFPVEAWDIRRKIFDAYLQEIDHAASTEECWRAYKAGVLARHLWAITSPERAKHFRPGEAELRLQAYAQTVQDPDLSVVATTALRALLQKRGLVALPPSTSNTTGPGRVRLSKRIAYALRHRLDLERDEAGWVRIALLAEELGHVSGQEIAAVATDPREARFEVRGDFIRARYGHSAELNHKVVFEGVVPAEVRLYHASPWTFAFEILDRQSGLRAKSRGMVHLTDSFDEAVASGVRGGHPLVYETTASRLEKVTKAGELTYLTPHVAASSLSVVPMSSYWTALPALSASLA